MPDLGQYTAWIKTDQRGRLSEYDCHLNEKTNTISCYIESKEDEEFEINWMDNTPTRRRKDLQVDVFFGDDMVAGHQMATDDEDRHFKELGYWTPSMGKKVKRFRFTNVTTCETGKATKFDGTIKVVFCAGTLYGDPIEADSDLDEVSPSATSDGKVILDEQSKELYDHGITYAPKAVSAEENAAFSDMTWRFKRDPRRPKATFVFKYNSLRQLQASNVLPTYEVLRERNVAMEAQIAELKAQLAASQR